MELNQLFRPAWWRPLSSGEQIIDKTTRPCPEVNQNVTLPQGPANSREPNREHTQSAPRRALRTPWAASLVGSCAGSPALVKSSKRLQSPSKIAPSLMERKFERMLPVTLTLPRRRTRSLAL